MKYLFSLGLGFLAGLACTAMGNFPFHYYTLSLPPECYVKGTLLGKHGAGGWMDLPLTTCMPDETGNKAKCITTLTSDFYTAKEEFLKAQTDLIDCQKRCK